MEDYMNFCNQTIDGKIISEFFHCLPNKQVVVLFLIENVSLNNNFMLRKFSTKHSSYYIRTYAQTNEEELKFIDSIDNFLDLDTAMSYFMEFTLQIEYVEEFSKINFQKYFKV
jgi:hypothetical protein